MDTPEPTKESNLPKSIWQRVHLPLRGRRAEDEAEPKPETVESQEQSTQPLVGQEYSLPTGQYLRHVRNTKGMSLKSISEATKIGVQYLEALEGDDYLKLPQGSYLIYIIAAYAKVLDLDSKSVVSDFKARYAENGASTASSQ